MQNDSHGNANAGGKTVTVTVYAAKSVEGKTFTWDKTMRVGDAALEAAKAFGLDATSPTLMKGSVVLDRDKPLVAAGVRDGDKLELVAGGGGV